MKTSIQGNKGFASKMSVVIIGLILVLGVIVYVASRPTDSETGNTTNTATSTSSVATTTSVTVKTSSTTPIKPTTGDSKLWVSYTGRYVSSPDLTFKVITDKREYTSQESIKIVLEVSNNSGMIQKLDFSTSCQGSYSLVSVGVQQTIVFDSTKNTACSTYENSVSVPAHSSQKIKLNHDPSVFKLAPGKYAVVGTVIGYGEASVPITITN